MPVVLLKYKPNRLPDAVMSKITAALPSIFADALTVHGDEPKSLTSNDIQIWVMEAHPFDKNIDDIQMMVSLHAYQERIDNIEARKNMVVEKINHILAGFELLEEIRVIGWVWILPSSNTAFGHLSGNL